MIYDYIFWDWNGTLFDDALTSLNAVNAMLDKRNLPNITFEQYRDYIDVPIVRFYEKVMDMNIETMESLSVEFNGLCKQFLPDNPLSASAKELLYELKTRGIKQYIFSSSQNKLIEPYLERFDIAKCFEAVLGAPDCYVGSKAERTRNYMIANNIAPEKAVFIGDMVHDSDVAAFCGSDCILISNGHQCESALAATGNKVFASLSAIINYL